MAASATDKFRKGVAQWSGNIGSAGVADAVVKTVPLASTSGLPTDTAVMITVNRVDTNGKKTGNYEGIVGVVSGSNLIDCIRGVEGTAQAWTGGTVVEVLHTADNLNDLIDGILVEHGQDGKHSSAVVTTLKATGAEINTGTDDAKIVTPKAITDAGLVKDNDGTLAANSDSKIPSQKAVKTYVDSGTVTMTNKTLTSPVINSPTSGFGFLNSRNLVTVESGAVISLKANLVGYFYGYVFVCNVTSGQTAIISVHFGGPTVAFQSGSEFVISSSPTTSQTGIYESQTTNVNDTFNLKNGFATEQYYSVFILDLR